MTVGGECGALELACSRNNVQVIALLGHSDCKAMNLLHSLRDDVTSPSPTSPLEQWLKTHGKETVEQYRKLEATDFKGKLIFRGAQSSEDDFEAFIDPKNELIPSDKFSQVNISFLFFSFLLL